METLKLTVLIDAGTVQDVQAIYQAEPGGWVLQITYATRSGEHKEVLRRQRLGVRIFATLDAAARFLARHGLNEFRVKAVGLVGETTP